MNQGGGGEAQGLRVGGGRGRREAGYSIAALARGCEWHMGVRVRNSFVLFHTARERSKKRRRTRFCPTDACSERALKSRL